MNWLAKQVLGPLLYSQLAPVEALRETNLNRLNGRATANPTKVPHYKRWPLTYPMPQALVITELGLINGLKGGEQGAGGFKPRNV